MCKIEVKDSLCINLIMSILDVLNNKIHDFPGERQNYLLGVLR